MWAWVSVLDVSGGLAEASSRGTGELGQIWATLVALCLEWFVLREASQLPDLRGPYFDPTHVAWG